MRRTLKRKNPWKVAWYLLLQTTSTGSPCVALFHRSVWETSKLDQQRGTFAKGLGDECKGAVHHTLTLLDLHCAQPWRDLWWNCRDGIGHCRGGRLVKESKWKMHRYAIIRSKYQSKQVSTSDADRLVTLLQVLRHYKFVMSD